jgi:hypothetical protein
MCIRVQKAEYRISRQFLASVGGKAKPLFFLYAFIMCPQPKNIMMESISWLPKGEQTESRQTG